MLQIPGAVIAFIYGVVVGSFLNVCIWRLPRDLSIIRPSSHCPKCKTPLKSRDLVPLFSFLVQGRKCRYCSEPITWRYFWIELVTGVYFVLLYARFAWDGELPGIITFIAYALFGSVLIAIFLIDLEHYIIPDQLNIFGIIIGLAYDGAAIASGMRGWQTKIFGASIPIPQSIFGMLTCGLAFLAIAIISYYVFKKEGMGGGDVKLAAAVGALLGAGYATASFMIAVLLGTIVGLALIAGSKKGRRDYVPFGPFMVVGALIVMFFQPQIAYLWRLYLQYAGIGGV